MPSLGRPGSIEVVPDIAATIEDIVGPKQWITHCFDNARTGWNPFESQLTPATVNSRAFGKLFSVEVCGRIYAQPLVANIKPDQSTVFVATSHNFVYAFDALTGARRWKTALTDDYETPVPGVDTQCWNIDTIGVVGTPVIDTRTQTLYVVAKSKVFTAMFPGRKPGEAPYRAIPPEPIYRIRLHALDIKSGHVKRSVEIAGAFQLNEAISAPPFKIGFQAAIPLAHWLRISVPGCYFRRGWSMWLSAHTAMPTLGSTTDGYLPTRLISCS